MKLPKPDWRSDWLIIKEEVKARELPFRVVGNIVVLTVLLTLFVVAAKHLEWITHHFNLGLLFVTIMAACFVLFFVRRFCRLGYGLLEFLLGTCIVEDTIFFGPPVTSNLDEPIIKIAAGMYLAIRGIDNCMHWLTPRLGGAAWWVRWIFRSE